MVPSSLLVYELLITCNGRLAFLRIPHTNVWFVLLVRVHSPLSREVSIAIRIYMVNLFTTEVSHRLQQTAFHTYYYSIQKIASEYSKHLLYYWGPVIKGMHASKNILYRNWKYENMWTQNDHGEFWEGKLYSIIVRPPPTVLGHD
jgi:hypothetical protein